MSAALGVPGVNGKLMIMGAAAKPLHAPAIPLIIERTVDHGLALRQLDRFLGYALFYCAHRSMERAAEAYDLMMGGKARFRALLTTAR